jgi:hypothetical protein
MLAAAGNPKFMTALFFSFFFFVRLLCLSAVWSLSFLLLDFAIYWVFRRDQTGRSIAATVPH